MNICGCLVHATVEKADAVRAGVAALEGAEIHGASDDGRHRIGSPIRQHTSVDP